MRGGAYQAGTAPVSQNHRVDAATMQRFGNSKRREDMSAGTAGGKGDQRARRGGHVTAS